MAAIIEQLGRLLPRAFGDQLKGRREAELRTSLRCYHVHTLPASGATPLASITRPLPQWHHQIAVDGNVAAFVRTSHETDDDNAAPEVASLGQGPLAGELEATLRLAMREAKPDAEFRLLLVPSHHITAVWEPAEDGLWIVQSPGGMPELEPGRRTSAAAFVSAIAERVPAGATPNS